MPWGPSGDFSGMETVTGVLLRTPGLFVIDYWYWFQRNKSGDSSSSSFTTEMVAYFALANGFLLLLLPISLLRTFYSHFLCGALVLAAHLLSYCFVRFGTQDAEQSLISAPSIAAAEAAEKIVGEVVADSVLAKLLSLLMLHVVIAMIVSCLLRGRKKPMLPILACYSLPVMARLADVPADSIQILHNLCFVVVGLSLVRYFICNSVASLFSSLKGIYDNVVLSISSIQGLVELVISFVGKIFVPIHFLLFCVISFAIKLQQISFSKKSEHNGEETWFVTLLSAAAAVCDSPVSLLSIAVTITYISHIFLTAVKLYLNSFGSHRHHAFHNDNDDPDQIHLHHIGPNDHRANQVQPRAMHTGWEEGVTTLLLAVLTGITDLSQTSRMAVLTIIFFVVISSLLQSMLEIAEPVILSLSAHHGKNLFHHLKVLLLCGFLFAFPLHITYVLTTVFPVDFWLAVVLSTSLLTSAQVLDLVVVHCLLWFDATRSEPWGPLDEVVYYVRALTKVVEFLVAFSVVVVGVYEAVTGQWNLTNAMILIVHCYFNVCQRFQSGLRSFIQRRRAVQKSANLPAATMQQLQKYRDICAICFMDMVTVSTSVITPCCHFFHRVCLRRWLSFHDRCPLCAAPVISDALSKDMPDCDRPAAPAPLPTDRLTPDA